MMYMDMSIRSEMMTEHHSIADARRNLPRLIREAQRGKTVRLTRRGEPVAVLVGHRTFERIVAGRRGFGEAYAEFAKTIDLAELDFGPAEFLESVRAPGPGRDVRW